jgi:FtsZ-binding cell division protein ZapB
MMVSEKTEAFVRMAWDTVNALAVTVNDLTDERDALRRENVHLGVELAKRDAAIERLAEQHRMAIRAWAECDKLVTTYRRTS